MMIGASNLIKNSFYAVFVQGVTLGVGILKSFILPILLGVIGFGYWQIYLLYVGFVGLFALGFNDGVYLKYGSYDYIQLPKGRLKFSLLCFALFEIFLSFLLFFCLYFFGEEEKKEILFYVILNIPLMGMIGFYTYIYQVTNQIKKYGLYSLLDKFIFVIVIIVLFLFDIDDYRLIIYLDIFSKILVLCFMMFSCQDILRAKGSSFFEGLEEWWNNILVGIKLMLALFTASLVMGIAKLFIEKFDDIVNFSCFSFACSAANILLFFVSGVALVIYPALKRLRKEKYGHYFQQMNVLVVSIFSVGLLTYYPLCYIVNHYMIDYVGIFRYFPLIMALIFLQSKMQIVINTFYKCLRAEGRMLKINLLNILLFFIFLGFFSFFFFFCNNCCLCYILFCIICGIFL